MSRPIPRQHLCGHSLLVTSTPLPCLSWTFQEPPGVPAFSWQGAPFTQRLQLSSEDAFHSIYDNLTLEVTWNWNHHLLTFWTVLLCSHLSLSALPYTCRLICAFLGTIYLKQSSFFFFSLFIFCSYVCCWFFFKYLKVFFQYLPLVELLLSFEMHLSAFSSGSSMEVIAEYKVMETGSKQGRNKRFTFCAIGNLFVILPAHTPRRKQGYDRKAE